MPTRLNAELVANALTTRLTDWEGDAERIHRTVDLSDEQDQAVREMLAVTAAAMNHDPEVERDSGRTTFTCWTHSAGGITELDIMLATRIDSHVRQVRREPPPPLPDTAVGLMDQHGAGTVATGSELAGAPPSRGGRHRAPDPDDIGGQLQDVRGRAEIQRGTLPVEEADDIRFGESGQEG